MFHRVYAEGELDTCKAYPLLAGDVTACGDVCGSDNCFIMIWTVGNYGEKDR